VSPRTATADDEHVTFLDAGPETIFAVLTMPVSAPLGIGVIILPGGGVPLTTGRNRMSVRICRDLSSMGFHALRLDYHGAGESTGSIRQLRLDQPFVRDVEAAMSFMRLQGVERFVLVGSCFGARTALAAAAEFSEVAGIAMISCPVRDFEMGQPHSVLAAERRSIWRYLARSLHPVWLRRLTTRQGRATYMRFGKAKLRSIFRRLSSHESGGERDVSRVSPRYLDQLRSVIGRGLPILLIYGDDEYLYEDFLRAQDSELGTMLNEASEYITKDVLEGSVHGFTRVKVQEEVHDRVRAWLSRFDAPRAAEYARTRQDRLGASHRS
jgi:pimeloyl-ACP methyl ester carboxylesterase